MAKISEFHLSPYELMKELAEQMERYLRKPDSEFLYDRIKFSNYQTPKSDYKKLTNLLGINCYTPCKRISMFSFKITFDLGEE